MKDPGQYRGAHKRSHVEGGRKDARHVVLARENDGRESMCMAVLYGDEVYGGG